MIPTVKFVFVHIQIQIYRIFSLYNICIFLRFQCSNGVYEIGGHHIDQERYSSEHLKLTSTLETNNCGIL